MINIQDPYTRFSAVVAIEGSLMGPWGPANELLEK